MKWLYLLPLSPSHFITISHLCKNSHNAPLFWEVICCRLCKHPHTDTQRGCEKSEGHQSPSSVYLQLPRPAELQQSTTTDCLDIWATRWLISALPMFTITLWVYRQSELMTDIRATFPSKTACDDRIHLAISTCRNTSIHSSYLCAYCNISPSLSLHGDDTQEYYPGSPIDTDIRHWPWWYPVDQYTWHPDDFV